MVALHKEEKSWVSLGLPFISRIKVGFHLGCENPTNACMYDNIPDTLPAHVSPTTAVNTRPAAAVPAVKKKT